jgi:hypothetical protein
VGVYSRDDIFRKTDETDATVFAPRMERELADVKYASWRLALSKSYDLDGLR